MIMLSVDPRQPRLNNPIALALAFITLSGCAATTNPGPPLQKATSTTPAAPAFKADDVMGKSAQEIDALFGDPALKRREGNGEFRRYALADCNIIVILYPDEKDTGSEPPSHVRTFYASAKTAGAAKPDADRCLATGL